MSQNAGRGSSSEVVLIGKEGEPVGVVDRVGVMETEVAARTYTAVNVSTEVVGFDTVGGRDEKGNPARQISVETKTIVEGSSYVGFANEDTEWLEHEDTSVRTIETCLLLSASWKRSPRTHLSLQQLLPMTNYRPDVH